MYMDSGDLSLHHLEKLTISIIQMHASSWFVGGYKSKSILDEKLFSLGLVNCILSFTISFDIYFKIFIMLICIISTVVFLVLQSNQVIILNFFLGFYLRYCLV